MTRLNVVDLFCGAGGLSAGLIDSGMTVVAAFDNSKDSVEIYNRNLSAHCQIWDLIDSESVAVEISKYSPDLIAGGPPCQDFSSAGKRREGKHANLTMSFCQIIEKCEPEFFLMENVPQARNSKAYQYLKQKLTKLGFQFSEQLIDASYFGVPQIRRRFFVFGWKQKKDCGKKFEQWLSEKCSDNRLTIKQYLNSEISIEHYYRHPRNYSRRSVFSVYEPSPTIRGVNRPVPPNYKGNHLDSVSPLQVRALTTWERSRIQTFPKSWKWNCSDRNAIAETNIGNAVPLVLSSYIGQGIQYAIN